MRLSEEKIKHISHLAFDTLAAGGTRILEDDAKVRRELKGIVTRWLRSEEELYEAVRRTIRSYSRNIVEGSPEWDVLFQKHYKEELSKRGRLG